MFLIFFLGLLDSSKQFGNSAENDDMLDIVGRGYNDRPIRQSQYRNDLDNSPYGLEAPTRQPEVVRKHLQLT